MPISDTAKKVTAHILHGNCLDVLQTLDSASVQTCVTSPPYFGLRDYGAEGQIGLEETPEQYVQKLVAVFREVSRVLRDDGTLWLNLGDSYSSHKDCKSVGQTLAKGTSRETAHEMEIGKSRVRDSRMLKSQGFKNKDLIGIPWMVAFALRADGWYLRQDIIWHKPNPMPESVKDRCTKAHEYIFLLSKSAKYFYDADAIAEPLIYPPHAPGNKTNAEEGGHLRNDYGTDRMTKMWGLSGKRNKRSVWTIATKPYTEAHFATFPIELPEICIKAGSREGDRVLDPFNGAASTGVAALRNGREYVGIELNPEYVALSKTRLTRIHPLFAEVRTETTAHSDIAEG